MKIVTKLPEPKIVPTFADIKAGDCFKFYSTSIIYLKIADGNGNSTCANLETGIHFCIPNNREVIPVDGRFVEE